MVAGEDFPRSGGFLEKFIGSQNQLISGHPGATTITWQAYVLIFSLLANGRKLMAWPGVVFVVVVVVVVGVVNNFFPASSPQKLLHRFL